jgi:glycosyl hydrolase family 20
MKKFANVFWCVFLALICGCQTGDSGRPSKSTHVAWLKSWRAANPVWRGVHLSAHNDRQVAALIEELPKLAAVGVNAVVVEVDYSFDFQSHPELRPPQFVTRASAQELAAEARAHGIRLIPQINCLGHQSWSRNTGQLLAKHPEFDETPGQFPDNQGIYCRSWCPQNPEVNKVVFALIDELADAFDADAFHVGMDEVFIIASEYCPRCKGGDPGKLFAKAANDLHRHIVGERKLEMLMWGDRLLDSTALGYSEWEASKNGTQGAIDLIPKDIIVCDWHYENRPGYPSVPLLLKKGFRVWPSGWQPLDATQAFSHFARQQKSDRMIGYLCTTWGKVQIPDASEWPPIKEVLEEWK